MATAEDKFGKFKTDVADQFNRDHAVKVAVCLNLKPAKRDEIKSARRPGLTLLKYLQDDDIIREDSIEDLCKALAHCGLKRIERIAKEKFEKYRKEEREGDRAPPSTEGTDAGSSSYDPGTLRGILQDDLTRIDCFELAIYFSLPDEVVNRVQESNIYAKELLDTLENRTIISERNISALLIALKDRGQQRVVNKIKAACEQHHLVTCEEDGLATHEEGSGDSVRCICGTSTFEEFKYYDKIVALECQNKDCLLNWVVTPTGSSSGWGTIKYGHQTLSYKPPGRLDLRKLKYKVVTDIEELNPGDHIVLRRGGVYDHHAILVSIKKESSNLLEVIHWTSGLPSSDSNYSFASIKKQDISFSSGGVKRAIYDRQDPVELVLARAFHKFQDKDERYSITENNCESLATYCKCGVYYSVQGQIAKKFLPFFQQRFLNMFKS